MARITGLGGFFFKSRDAAALSAWYRDILGLEVQSWGGAQLEPSESSGPPHAVWSPFAADTTYFEPGTSPYMVNFAVDDLDAFVTQLVAKGVAIIGRDENEQTGRFAWLLDPEGTKLELWQPPAR